MGVHIKQGWRGAIVPRSVPRIRWILPPDRCTPVPGYRTPVPGYRTPVGKKKIMYINLKGINKLIIIINIRQNKKKYQLKLCIILYFYIWDGLCFSIAAFMVWGGKKNFSNIRIWKNQRCYSDYSACTAYVFTIYLFISW